MTCIVKEIIDKVEEIKNDASIPMRSSKKTGAKSKKEVREQVQNEVTHKLQEVATKNNYVSGKWLIFAPSDKVDKIWKDVATSLVSGLLSSTSALSAKVATSPEQETPNYQHVICLYIPDVYNKSQVTEVMKILLRNHGLNLSGVKSNLYTLLGIDSKHPSGIPSTIWKNTALLSESEIKDLKDAFFSDLTSAKPAAVEKSGMNGETSTVQEEKTKQDAPTKTKKAQLKSKKKVPDDPFASDDENDSKEEEKRRQEVQTKKAPLRTSKRRRDSEDEEDEEKPIKRKGHV